MEQVEYEYTYHKVKCSFCGREILVEQILFGVPHTATILASCKECLKKSGLPEKFKKDHPKEAKEIEQWITDGDFFGRYALQS